MAEYMIQGETLTAIADAIRAKLESSDQMLPSEMAALIESITGAKVMVGKFTVAAENNIKSYKITHGLGAEPNLVMLTKFDSFYQTGKKHLWSLAQTSVGGGSVSAYRASAGGMTTFETGSWSISSNETDTTISTSESVFMLYGTYYYVIGVI